MSLRRAASSNRFAATIWPGFVDAMTALLMVLMFVLTIFMIVQSVLREQITSQDDRILRQQDTIARQEQRLDSLGRQVAALGQALTASEQREDALQGDLDRQQGRADSAEAALARAEAEARDRAARITRMNNQLATRRAELDAATLRLTDFEAEVAALIAARAEDQSRAEADRGALQAGLKEAQSRASAAELAVAAARRETDAEAEQARLAAARSAALQALVADLRRRNQGAEAATAALQSDLTASQSRLDEAEAARLAEAEAARLLRERLESADSELTAMTLALEESRRAAEETLTLLAAAEAARDDLDARAAETAGEAERQAALLETAREALARQESLSEDSQRRVALLNEQVASLTAQLGALQALLDTAGADQQQAELRVADLGQQLNAALLRAAEEKDRRLALEEQARLKAEEEARDLARYRSEFFGRLSQILSGREGVQVVGDRFVFQSEVLFAPGEATLSAAGQDQVASVARLLAEISDEIPPEIDWIIRVDGHTDSTPLSGSGRWRDNWELSQARALAVVRYLTDQIGFPPDRLAAAGFSDTRPVADGTRPEDLAQNRRIELKLTER
ncbi:peptidoglycan -binding protein [Paracoccus spongiarum]|uniref:Peptidoglycan -binding protein n=1 Tax=Paracoccus spongiarum TaxID=3064387 RepID=A0ABT9JDA7_9RHOB|nr:peptidoglycan -binding protein [Paracoccus sp. 2205BS29-5]MDP5307813.1 peptidoglycan -binding protein [Paracoccus sp. 2205BS29-5]